MKMPGELKPFFKVAFYVILGFVTMPVFIWYDTVSVIAIVKQGEFCELSTAIVLAAILGFVVGESGMTAYHLNDPNDPETGAIGIPFPGTLLESSGDFPFIPGAIMNIIYWFLAMLAVVFTINEYGYSISIC